MDTNAKRNEHPACSCEACIAGARSKAGQARHRAVNRQIRHRARLELSRVSLTDLEVMPTIVSTGFTD